MELRMDAEQPAPAEADRSAGSTRSLRRLALRVAGYVLLGYVAWCAALFFWQDRMVFPADVAGEPLPGDPRPPMETLSLPIPGGGDVVAWFAPAPGAAYGAPAPLVIYCHGNAELIDFQDFVLAGYRRLGVSVLLPEYRGYGRSAGRPSQAAIVEDVVRFRDLLIGRPGVDASRIILHGHSLGGGVAAQVAVVRRPAALILQSTFTSLASFSGRYLAPSFLARHPFRTDRVLPGLDLPLLIMHGARDDIVPVTHGRRLRALAPAAMYMEFDCGHLDMPGDGHHEAYWRLIRRFLSDHGVLPASAGPTGLPRAPETAESDGS